MRPKFVLALVVVAVLILAAAWYYRANIAHHQPPVAVVTTVVTPPVTADSNVADALLPAPVTVVAPAPKPMTPEQKQEYIEAETSRLHDWSMQNDPASLSGILNGLTNSEKEVRLAAIEATKQFGSKDAIPALEAEVANATDTDEKVALLQAADFLSLPTIADVNDQTPKTPEQLQAIQQSRQKAAARKQYLMQKHAQNANGVPPPAQTTQPPQ